MVRIRPARESDEPALYDICLRTGDSGEDASGLYADPRLPGELYVGPYLHLPGTLAYVAEDSAGVAGYVLGAVDTAAFETALERTWLPPLRERYPRDRFPAGSPDARIVTLLHDPPVADPGLLVGYPAHLHVDLLPRMQGQGAGRALMETLFEALSAAGVPGAHLGVGRTNRRAIAFYEHLGFDTAAVDDLALTMTRALSPQHR